MEEKELLELFSDTQKHYAESNRMKDKIIILLIALMFLEAVVGYSGFVWYESQFDYAETTTTTIETDNSKDVDVSSDGEATYIDGNQYNNSSHTESDGDE